MPYPSYSTDGSVYPVVMPLLKESIPSDSNQYAASDGWLYPLKVLSLLPLIQQIPLKVPSFLPLLQYIPLKVPEVCCP